MEGRNFFNEVVPCRNDVYVLRRIKAKPAYKQLNTSNTRELESYVCKKKNKPCGPATLPSAGRTSVVESAASGLTTTNEVKGVTKLYCFKYNI